MASPQVPSPQGQTLDLSVNRISQRYIHFFFHLFHFYLVLKEIFAHYLNQRQDRERE
jgi:hypothetical protein